jgi:hypothetical protein
MMTSRCTALSNDEGYYLEKVMLGGLALASKLERVPNWSGTPQRRSELGVVRLTVVSLIWRRGHELIHSVLLSGWVSTLALSGYAVIPFELGVPLPAPRG